MKSIFLLQMIYSLAPFPFPQLIELREKYTYNITPFTAAMSTGQKPTRKGAINVFDDDELDEDELIDNISCFTGFFPGQVSPVKAKSLGMSNKNYLLLLSNYYHIDMILGTKFNMTTGSRDRWIVPNHAIIY